VSTFSQDSPLLIADRCQRGFPLVERPFAEIGRIHRQTEHEILHGFGNLIAAGQLGRIGAIVRPHSAGCSTLAAMSVPQDALFEVAAIVSEEAYVNHNYERDHTMNLWFVVTAPGEGELLDTLDRISLRTGKVVHDLRLVEPYYIDLGFGIAGKSVERRSHPRPAREANARERRLLAALEDGLPLVTRPYQVIASTLAWSEREIIDGLSAMLEANIISRFGCVLRHRELGYIANAMTVWDVDDANVDEVGRRLAQSPAVTLCYRRQRSRPAWPYNLYAMIHGRRRSAVRREIAAISRTLGLNRLPHEVLFSTRCFLQRGARFRYQAQAAA
jgi:DNA-binding Lrp family transcriptional regulator